MRIGGTGKQQQQQGGDIASMRQSYDRGGLTEDQADPDPYKQFDRSVACQPVAGKPCKVTHLLAVDSGMHMQVFPKKI